MNYTVLYLFFSACLAVVQPHLVLAAEVESVPLDQHVLKHVETADHAIMRAGRQIHRGVKLAVVGYTSCSDLRVLLQQAQLSTEELPKPLHAL